MAYNRHFICKRKNAKVNQTNSSAKVNSNDVNNNSESFVLSKSVLDEARKNGVLILDKVGLKEIPDELYFINKPSSQDMYSFDYHQNSSWWDDVLLYKVVLSSNRISHLSSNIKQLNNLVHLDLSNNLLAEVPQEIEQLVLLRYLNLAKNKLTTLPENLGYLYDLENLNIAFNNIKVFPTQFGKLVNLEILDISGNNLSRVPDVIGNFIKLKRLIMANNKFISISSSMSNLKELTYLDISSNRISVFPKDIVANFEIIDVSINLLPELPIYNHMPSLQEIYASNNMITQLTVDNISNIPNINKLILTKNAIDILPSELSFLKCLTHLDVSFNCLNSVPYTLGSMDTLVYLIIEGNPFRSINRTIMKSGTKVLKQYLRNRNSAVLAASNHLPIGCEEIDESWENDNKNLTVEVNAHDLNSKGLINLKDKGIKVIPSDFFQSLKTKCIQSIILSNNKLSVFPLGLTSFGHNLSRMDISQNRLTELPNIFGSFKKLEYLNISENFLHNLPDSFTLMANSLQILDISYNPLGMYLPNCVYMLKNLYMLNAVQCSIAHLDCKLLKDMEKLINLDLSNNEIENLPPELGNCVQIKNLNLEGNKIRAPTANVIGYGTDALLQYLRSSENQKRNNHETTLNVRYTLSANT